MTMIVWWVSPPTKIPAPVTQEWMEFYSPLKAEDWTSYHTIVLLHNIRVSVVYQGISFSCSSWTLCSISWHCPLQSTEEEEVTTVCLCWITAQPCRNQQSAPCQQQSLALPCLHHHIWVIQWEETALSFFSLLQEELGTWSWFWSTFCASVSCRQNTEGLSESQLHGFQLSFWFTACQEGTRPTKKTGTCHNLCRHPSISEGFPGGSDGKESAWATNTFTFPPCHYQPLVQEQNSLPTGMEGIPFRLQCLRV